MVIVNGTRPESFCQYFRIGKSMDRAAEPSTEQFGYMAIQLVVVDVVVVEVPCRPATKASRKCRKFSKLSLFRFRAIFSEPASLLQKMRKNEFYFSTLVFR